MSDAMRLGIVGCGRLAEAGYLPALAKLGCVQLTAVADPDPARRGAIARSGGGSIAEFDGAEALAAAAVVDAALVATPVETHVADATALALAGIPCLVEKPPAADAQGAAALAALTPAPRVGFNRRFSHGARLMDAAEAEHELDLELELNYRRASWGAFAVGDAAILDLAPHLVDLALWLTGSAHARVVSASLSGERADLDLELERGTARIACATDRAHSERVLIRAGGRVVGRSREGGPIALVATRIPGREHPLVSSLRAQVMAFQRAVRGLEAPPLATAADGVKVMRVIDEAREVAA